MLPRCRAKATCWPSMLPHVPKRLRVSVLASLFHFRACEQSILPLTTRHGSTSESGSSPSGFLAIWEDPFRILVLPMNAGSTSSLSFLFPLAPLPSPEENVAHMRIKHLRRDPLFPRLVQHAPRMFGHVLAKVYAHF